MSGNRIGGLKAAQTNKKRYGKNFYDTIGRLGGTISRGGGFTRNPELARMAGKKGGKTSSNKGVLRTHCKRGHEFTPENIYVNVSAGSRQCLTCRRRSLALYQQRQRDSVKI